SLNRLFMKLRIIGTATLFAPFCLAASVSATTIADFKQLPSQPCLTCRSTIAAQPVQVASADWKNFSSGKGKFAVLMPGKPIEETQTSQKDDVTINNHTFMVETDEGVFFVEYSDFRDDISMIKPDAILEAGCEGLSQDGGKLLSKRSIALGEHPGREVEYTTKDGITGKARIFLVGQRLYQLHVVTAQAADANKFFDSFKVKQ
ncbi:MAG TPA: hypothetical protein V6D12_10555, partial [Candidatus Obscuribacterales bacterium]